MDRPRAPARRAASTIAVGAQVRLGCAGAGPMCTAVVGGPDVGRAGIGVGVDGDRLDAHLATRPRDADGDLAAIGDEQPTRTAACRSSLTAPGVGPGAVFAQTAPSGCLCAKTSQRDVAVLARRVRVALALEHPERGDDARPGLRRHDDVVEVAAAGRHLGIGEALLVLGGQPRQLRCRVRRRRRSRRGR